MNARLEDYHRRMAIAEMTARSPESMTRHLPDGVAALSVDRIPKPLLGRLRRAATADEWPFYFHGQCGRGKTCTAAAIFMAWKSSALWMSFTELVDRASTLSEKGHVGLYDASGRFCEFTRESWWRHIASVGLVVVDEVGSGVSSAQRTEILWTILEKRHGKPLVLTGNLDLDDVQHKFDGRIYSRLVGGTSIEFRGHDIRGEGFDQRTEVVTIDNVSRAAGES